MGSWGVEESNTPVDPQIRDGYMVSTMHPHGISEKVPN